MCANGRLFYAVFVHWVTEMSRLEFQLDCCYGQADSGQAYDRLMFRCLLHLARLCVTARCLSDSATARSLAAI
jgi:hypothetical protein